MKRTMTAALAVLTMAACTDDGPAGPSDDRFLEGGEVCDLEPGLLWASLPPEAIPALTEPTFVARDDPAAAYVRAGDRVLGLVVDGLFGRAGAVQGIRVGADGREIVYLQPALTWSPTSTTSLEAGLRLPVHGRNHPAGSPLSLALFQRFPF